MKRSVKIISLLISAIVGSFIYYNNSGKLKFDNNIELKQVPLDIKSLNVENSHVWRVKTDSDLVNFSLVFKNEGERSFHKTPGLLDLTLSTIHEGAGKYDSIALKKLLTDHSIVILMDYTRDDLIVTCSCLSKYFEILTNLLCDIMTQSHFDNEKLEITKQNIMVSIKQSMFSPNSKAVDKLNELLFPENHPYRTLCSDILKKLPDYKRDDVLKCYKQLFTTKNAEITIVSNLSDAKIQTNFSKILNSLKSKSNDFHKVEQTDFNIPPGETHVEMDNPQSSVLFLLPGIDISSKDYFAASVVNSIFGEVGLISRLSKCVRDKNGLVYRIQSNLHNSDLCSYVFGNADTRPENVKKVIEIIKDKCEEIYKNGITQEELESAKARKFSQNIFDSNASILSFILKIRSMKITDLNEVNGILNKYKNLSLEDVNRVVKKIFDPKCLMFIDCGKAISKGDGK